MLMTWNAFGSFTLSFRPLTHSEECMICKKEKMTYCVILCSLSNPEQPMYKFPLYTKGFSGCWLSQCDPQGAHIPQLTIQLNNECEGRIGWTLAKPFLFFFFIWEVCVGERRVAMDWLDHRCRDSLVGGIRDRVAVLFITSAAHGGGVWTAHETAAIKNRNGQKKRRKISWPKFLSIHLDASLSSLSLTPLCVTVLGS